MGRVAGRVMGLVLGVGWLGFVFGWVVGCLVVGSGVRWFGVVCWGVGCRVAVNLVCLGNLVER